MADMAPTLRREVVAPTLRRLAVWLAALFLAWGALSASAAEAVPAAADPVLEARMLKITSELRCLVCQNQTIADSHADLARDLRRQVREMLERGDSDEQCVFQRSWTPKSV